MPEDLDWLESLWTRRDRMDLIKVFESQLEESSEWPAEWETERERSELELRRLEQRNTQRYTLADKLIPDFTGPFATKVARLGLTPPNPITAELCSLCKDIPQRLIGDIPLLERGAACEFCRLIFRLGEKLHGQYRSQIHVSVQTPYLMVPGKAQQSWGQDLRLHAESDSKTALLDCKAIFHVLPEVGDEFYFLLLREWLEDCTLRHGNHADHFRLDPKLPTRVLDVGDRAKLRLRCTEGEKGTYIALSHRWGEAVTFSTTRENIREFCQEIEMDQLPKTFQDAVEVTQELGIRYLWIDSLCIIQNDREDWERESKRMESVFTSAYCTIAATSAKNCTEGFLRRQPLKHCVRLLHGENTYNPHSNRVDDDFNEYVEKGILNQRAWVFQERALSRRIIHFTAAQTYWECGSVIRSECLRDSFRQLDWLGDSNFPQTASRLLPEIADSMFVDIFTRYSSLGITNLEDRPVAIQGLESRLANFHKTNSVYGILECFLHISLLWQRSGNAKMQPIMFKDMKVPSWSWMAYAGEIRYGAKHDWNQTKITGSNSNLELDIGERRIIASIADFTRGCRIERAQNTDCTLKGSNGQLVGWMRFDQNDVLDVKAVRCIPIGKSAGEEWKKLTDREYRALRIGGVGSVWVDSSRTLVVYL
ncbi:heterokaryon incompatibility protein-domain-containing protein [Pyrenochaeta sp. MPI-SDFR-AT-0127]|nr:heterokaryon incompatibility protein-domain-containing protein [Pyrenochaeta sp. MPI-SDFR-AT-0127]